MSSQNVMTSETPTIASLQQIGTYRKHIISPKMEVANCVLHFRCYSGYISIIKPSRKRLANRILYFRVREH